jgi:hypothetical protein
MRLSAGWSTEEVVVALINDPGRLRYNAPPKDVVTRGWVMNRMRCLREEIRATMTEG